MIPVVVSNRPLVEAHGLGKSQCRPRVVHDLSFEVAARHLPPPDRARVARALLTRPALPVLDEPTTGPGPQGRRLVWERIRALKAGGTTILLTTHYMEEAARLCDRLIIMEGGRIVAAGTAAQLIEQCVGD